MKMQLTADNIYLASTPVDFRKGISGLIESVIQSDFDPNAGTIYVFYNRTKNRLKLLSRHQNGFVMIYKRIDKKVFSIPSAQSTTPMKKLSLSQLSWLIAGLDWELMSASPDCVFTDYF